MAPDPPACMQAPPMNRPVTTYVSEVDRCGSMWIDVDRSDSGPAPFRSVLLLSTSDPPPTGPGRRRTKWAEVNLLWRRQRAAMQPFLFGKQPAAPTSSRNAVQTYDEAVASGTLILSASGVKCKCGAAFGHDWGPLTRIKRECSTRAGGALSSESVRSRRSRAIQPRRSASEPPPSLAPTR